ncbi:MAG: hypothetical protein ACXWDO_00600 [Bacteroidia bacterium]
MKYLRLLLLLYIILPQNALAQKQINDTGINVSLIGVAYSFNLPGGDLSDRFGSNSTIGASYWFKHKSNWLFGAEYNYIFGTQVREKGMFSNIDTEQGYLINGRGELQVLKTLERGHLAMLKVGKIFPNIIKTNPNSGLFVKAGAGFMEHKIKYYWAGQDPPQLMSPYYKGYDRLSNGLALSQSIGFLKLDSRNYFNFMAEFEVVEGFTKNRRDWNYDTLMKDDKERLDLMFALKLSWFFPIYRKTAEGFYFE